MSNENRSDATDAPATPVKPMLTEWRYQGGIWKRWFAHNQMCSAVTTAAIDGGTFNWSVWKEPATPVAVAMGEPTIEAAKFAADTAARQWYRLPVEVAPSSPRAPEADDNGPCPTCREDCIPWVTDGSRCGGGAPTGDHGIRPLTDAEIEECARVFAANIDCERENCTNCNSIAREIMAGTHGRKSNGGLTSGAHAVLSHAATIRARDAVPPSAAPAAKCEDVDAKPLRLDAYYYGFTETGNRAIDRILSAVACAGKAFHGTESWNDETTPFPGHVGKTPIDWIQNAANDAAARPTAGVDDMAVRRAETEARSADHVHCWHSKSDEAADAHDATCCRCGAESTPIRAIQS